MKRSLLFFFIISLICRNANAKPPVEEGKTIFTSRCAGCHNVNKQVVGPALAGVDKRHSIDWIINFVQSSQTVIKGGDKQANELFAKFNKIQMPDHKDLTADNIKSIVEFIKNSSVEATKTGSGPVEKQPAQLPSWLTNYGVLATFFGLALLLIGSLLMLVKVKKQLRLKGLK